MDLFLLKSLAPKALYSTNYVCSLKDFRSKVVTVIGFRYYKERLQLLDEVFVQLGFLKKIKFFLSNDESFVPNRSFNACFQSLEQAL